MGRYKNGIQGPFSGKIGTVVGASCRGINYMRGLSNPSSKPPTPAQVNQRLKFALAVGWLTPLSEFIETGYQQSYEDGKTTMNRAISFHLNNGVITGTGPDYGIDFKKSVFSRGDSQSSWLLEAQSVDGCMIHLKWDDRYASAYCNDNDMANFIAYSPTKERFVTYVDVAMRSDNEVHLMFPEDFAGTEVHCWMHYVDASGKKVSTTLYLGEMAVFS